MAKKKTPITKAAAKVATKVAAKRKVTHGVASASAGRGDGSDTGRDDATASAAADPWDGEGAGSPSGWNPEDELSLTVVSHDDAAVTHGKTVPLLMARYNSARVTVPFYISGKTTDAGKRWQKIIGYHKQLTKYANGGDVKFSSVDPAGGPALEYLEEFGELLFETLFPNDVRTLYNVARFRHKNRRLKIIFTSMIPWVADIPWEFAFDRAANSFLSCGDVRFVRNVLTPTPANTITEVDRPLRILVVSAQPSNEEELSIEEEERGIHESFRQLIDAGLVVVDVLARATPARLHEWLRYQRPGDEFDILHFIGHGYFDEAERTGYLMFQDDSGRGKPLSAASFLKIVQGRNIRIMFLNACETGRGAKADYNRGVAMALVHDGIPTVVANQYSVIDRSATLFSLHFYACLAYGLNVADAMREARIAMNYCGIERTDWGVPVLFATYPDARLCQPKSRHAKAAAAAAGSGGQDVFSVLSRSAARSGAAPKRGRKTVAIWDAENSLVYRENLKATLDEMNAAQDRFDFQLKRFSAPPGLWSPDNSRNEDRVAYLRSEKVMGRMERIRAAIETDYLFCVTNLPLRDSTTTALYYVLEDSVAIFSVWNLQPPLKGRLLKKALVNHLAIALLDWLSDISGGDNDEDPLHPIHTVGFWNNRRRVDHIAGRMQLTAASREEIEAVIEAGQLTQAQFAAIETLLRMYED